MKIKLLTFILAGILSCVAANAQTYNLVTIHDIQFVPSDTLANCHDKGVHVGDTVRVRGVAYMKGNQSTAYLTGKLSTAREIYIQDGFGAWSGLDVFVSGAGNKTFPVDIQSLVPGDSIEVTGVVSEFSGQTEVIPFFKTKGGSTFSNQVKYLGTSKVGAKYKTVKLSDFNDSKQVNQLKTGEQWEAGYVELKNVSVVAASAQNAARIQFTVQDSAGNQMIVFDKFLVQRNSANPDTFKVPHVGDVFSSLKGTVAHFASGGPTCTTGTYELYPFDTSHYHYSLSAPIILSVTRSPLVPKSTNAVTVTANVIQFGKRGIKEVDLYYKTGADTSIATGYTKVVMTASGANYVGTIPSQSNGTTVKYYVTAIDTVTIKPLRSYSPSIKSPGIFPYFYTVRDGGLTIFDVQFRPAPGSSSAYLGNRVVVSGVVTASTKDLGYVYIQQPGLPLYAGINLKGSVQLVNLTTGDNVVIGGTVAEASGFTSINVDSIAKTTGTATIAPVKLIDTLLTLGDLKNRGLMGMLVTLKPVGSKLKVVQLNADGSSNFGDFRLGDDATKPTIGTRVSSGYNNANDPQSLNVAYANDASLLANIKVTPNRALTTSDNMDSVRGIIIYNFSNYKVMPRTTGDIYGISNPVHVHDGGIKSVSNNNSFNLYPNPSQGRIFVDLTENNGASKLIVSDMMGKTVYSENLSAANNHYELNVNLKAGAYIVTMFNASGITGQAKLLISK